VPLETPKAGTDSDDYGFTSTASAHTGRTMMFNELSRILDSTSRDCPAEEIKRLIVEENILQKSTFSGRKYGFTSMNQLINPFYKHSLNCLYRNMAFKHLLKVIL